MDRLPEELFCCVFDCLHVAKALSSAMLVSRRWYLCGARNLHHRVVLSLSPGLSVSSSDVAISFMKRLVSPTLSTAHYIHHLVLTGFAALDLQELILDILGRALALRSLNMQSLHNLQGGMLISPDVFSSEGFLPNLSALNTNSAQFCIRLSHMRRLTSIRVHEPMDIPCTRCLLSGSLADRIESLQIAVGVCTMSDAVDRVAEFATLLAAAPLRSLCLQFVQDRPGLALWAGFERAVRDMGPSLRRLAELRDLSIVTRPDPVMPVPQDAEVTPGDQYRELVTKTLAERIVKENGLTGLRRIELRWHGWAIRDAEWISLPRTQLLRLPQAWLSEDFGASDT